MKNILVIESSSRGGLSFSDKLVRAVVDKLREKNSEARVTVRNLAQNPFPHLEESHLAAFYTPPEKRSPADQATARRSDEAVAELMGADAIVIGVPMYNFTVPSALKAWIDHIVRAGLTFSYGTAGRPEGLVKGKKVYLAIASGGIYTEGPMKSYDFTEPYLRAILGFLGMTDVSAFRVEGLNVPDVKAGALAKAVESVQV